MINNFKKRSCFGKVVSILLIISTIITGLSGCNPLGTMSPNNNAKSLNVSSADKKDSVLVHAQDSNNTANVDPIYKSTSLGLSLAFPSNWSSKYTVKETSQGIFVYFKPMQKSDDGSGLYFCILKKTKNINESMYDSINGKREVNVNGISYFLGGPTDISFPENHSEFSIFIQLQKQIPDIINSIKPLN